jgi:hypothetical protein
MLLLVSLHLGQLLPDAGLQEGVTAIVSLRELVSALGDAIFMRMRPYTSSQTKLKVTAPFIRKWVMESDLDANFPRGFPDPCPGASQTAHVSLFLARATLAEGL